MPYKTGSMKGELTTPEIRKLIKAHNILTNIKIPKGAKRDEIIKIVNDKGYTINHDKQSLYPMGGISKGRPKVTMKKAQEVTKPKPKTALETQKAAESKAEKAEMKKKEVRAIKKEAIEQQNKVMDRKKTLKKKSVEKKKEDMPDEKKIETKVKELFKDFDFFHNFAGKFFNMVDKEFGGDLEKVKENLTGIKYDKFIGEGDKPIAGFKEYYKGMNGEEIKIFHQKIKPEVIKYSRIAFAKERSKRQSVEKREEIHRKWAETLAKRQNNFKIK
jgi:hypothetical protein